MKPKYLGALAIFLLATNVDAQHHQAPSTSSYSNFAERPIKALSDQQVADLRAGRGMGLALAAELNGYPGPSHALELADRLGLTGDQRSRIEALLVAMKQETIPLGEQTIELEAALEWSFANRTVTAPALASATEEIGVANARLRNAHLNYHLAMRDVLNPAQVERYNALRGYGNNKAGHQHQSSP